MFSERLKTLRKNAQLTQIKFAQQFNVANGTVGMWETGKREPDFETVQRIADFFNVSIDYLMGRDDPEISPSRKGVLIPVLGDVAAGIPIEAVTDILDYEEIDSTLARSGEFFALRIKGASMEPRMRDGDIVIVRKQETADTGDTVVVMVNGDSATVKKIKIGADGITLIPSNPAYDPMFYSAAEVEQLPVRVIGRVVELRAKF